MSIGKIEMKMTKSRRERLDALAREVINELDTELANIRRQGGKHCVFGEGDPGARVVFIGEAPGRKESETGRPFVGAAGKLLDQMLVKIGLERESVYITNVVKDRPPGNRKPRVGEIEAYRQYLFDQIDIIQPRVIVPLGNVSTSVILNKFDVRAVSKKMGDLHGKIFACDVDWGQVAILPMYHPAASFYGSLTRADLQADFEILLEVLRGE